MKKKYEKAHVSEGTAVLKESKNKIRVDFDRTSRWTRFKIKYLSSNFVVSALWYLFRLGLLIGVSYVILQPFFFKDHVLFYEFE